MSLSYQNLITVEPGKRGGKSYIRGIIELSADFLERGP